MEAVSLHHKDQTEYMYPLPIDWDKMKIESKDDTQQN